MRRSSGALGAMGQRSGTAQPLPVANYRRGRWPLRSLREAKWSRRYTSAGLLRLEVLPMSLPYVSAEAAGLLEQELTTVDFNMFKTITALFRMGPI
eukprot:2565538-Pleurochrysis_carterae.AAC.1